jgi:hypothetical protein
MPQRNRVDPWGQLIETPARGAWFGNRGCLHDDRGRITDRKPPTDAWIICRLEFKGRRRPLLQPGHYTELFFLDEATALAAGHRPCGECRHDDLRLFGALWPHKRRRAEHALAPEIDAVLARERADTSDPARIVEIDSERLPPDGVMLSFTDDAEDDALLCARGALWRWSPAGYEGPLRWRGRREALMLTPAATTRTIANGYRPQIHPSARR